MFAVFKSHSYLRLHHLHRLFSLKLPFIHRFSAKIFLVWISKVTSHIETCFLSTWLKLYSSLWSLALALVLLVVSTHGGRSFRAAWWAITTTRLMNRAGRSNCWNSKYLFRKVFEYSHHLVMVRFSVTVSTWQCGESMRGWNTNWVSPLHQPSHRSSLALRWQSFCVSKRWIDLHLQWMLVRGICKNHITVNNNSRENNSMSEEEKGSTCWRSVSRRRALTPSLPGY